MTINKVILLGRLGRDPETRTGSSGKKVCNFSMATTEKWTSNGESKEAVEWHNVVIFNQNLINVAERHLRKGKRAYVEGSNFTTKFTDRNGIEKRTTQIAIKSYSHKLVVLDFEQEKPSQADDENFSEVPF